MSTFGERGKTGVRVVCISQVRMESTRLPGKVLMDLGGKPVVQRVFERLARSKTVDEVVLALPDTESNDGLAAACEAFDASVYRGSLDDVLARYAGAARAYDADVVVRVTSDCPFADPALVDSVVERLLADSALDYASNNLVRTYPLGFDAEAFRAEALFTADAEAVQPHEREHVTPYLYQHPERFRLANVKAPPSLTRPSYRITVDEPADLELARRIWERLDGDGFSAAEVVTVLDADEMLRDVNAQVRNKDVAKPASW